MYDFDLSKPQPRVMQVDLVSFVPGPAGGQAYSDAPSGLQKKVSPESVDISSDPDIIPLDLERVKAIAASVAELKPDISLKAKPANLKELMAAQEKKDPIPPKSEPKVVPEEVLKKAREKMAQKIEKQNQKQISTALSRLQAAVAATGNKSPDKKSQGDALGQGIVPGTGTGTGLGKQGYSPLDIYKSNLEYAIGKNWVFNDMLARMDKHLEVSVMIKILKDGEIRDISYETKSGNRYLDQSAKNALKRANPLPALPSGMDSYDLVVIFTPEGLK
ncbi:MAG: TonB family protein [Desulfobacteraceae bacterium]|nr:TonB family protein [Desulfobacteraceae bacterium]